MLRIKPAEVNSLGQHGNTGRGENQQLVRNFLATGNEACEILYAKGRSRNSVANRVTMAIRSIGLEDQVKVLRRGERIFLVRVGDKE